LFSPCLSVCMCVNKPKSGSEDMSCSVDCGPPCKWLRVAGVCMFVLPSQQNVVSAIALQSL